MFYTEWLTSHRQNIQQSLCIDVMASLFYREDDDEHAYVAEINVVRPICILITNFLCFI